MLDLMKHYLFSNLNEIYLDSNFCNICFKVIFFLLFLTCWFGTLFFKQGVRRLFICLHVRLLWYVCSLLFSTAIFYQFENNAFRMLSNLLHHFSETTILAPLTWTDYSHNPWLRSLSNSANLRGFIIIFFMP